MKKDVGILWRRLTQSAAQPELWMDLVCSYAHAGLLWQAGYAARQAIKYDEKLLARLQGLELGPWRDITAGDALLGRSVLPEAAERAEQFQTHLAEYPGDWLTWLYQARLQELLAPPEEKSETARTQLHLSHELRQAHDMEYLPGESFHWIGVWRLRAGDADGAIAALSGLVFIHPVRYSSMMYLGEALLRIGLFTAAEKAFSRAELSPHPEFP